MNAAPPVEIPEGVCEAAGRILAVLRARPAMSDELASVSKCSRPTAHRALRAMRDAGAKLVFSRTVRTWSLLLPWSRPPELLTRAELVARYHRAEIWRARCRRYEQHMAENVPPQLWPHEFMIAKAVAG